MRGREGGRWGFQVSLFRLITACTGALEVLAITLVDHTVEIGLQPFTQWSSFSSTQVLIVLFNYVRNNNKTLHICFDNVVVQVS